MHAHTLNYAVGPLVQLHVGLCRFLWHALSCLW